MWVNPVIKKVRTWSVPLPYRPAYVLETSPNDVVDDYQSNVVTIYVLDITFRVLNYLRPV